jgi:formiminotetrahydrofolate cyclodeaminase
MTDIFAEKDGYGLISLQDINKITLSSISDKVVMGVVNGYEDALEVYIKAKALSQIADNIIDRVKEEAITDAERAAGSNTLGCEVQVKSVPNQFSFSHDDEWRLLDEEIKKLSERKKAREKQMVEAMKYAELVDVDGFIIPPAEIKKYGGTTLSIIIPKQ